MTPGKRKVEDKVLEYETFIDEVLKRDLQMAANWEASASTSSAKKRKTLTLETKYEIIQLSDGGMKACEIAAKMSLAQTTVRTIVKDKERLLSEVRNARPMKSTIIRKRHGLVAEMESLLNVWCLDRVKLKTGPVNQSAVCNKAKLIFARLKEEAGDEAKDDVFLASYGWFNRFKQRCDWHNIAGASEAVIPSKEAAIAHEAAIASKEAAIAHEAAIASKEAAIAHEAAIANNEPVIASKEAAMAHEEAVCAIKEDACAIKEEFLSFPSRLEEMIQEGGYCSRTVFNVDEMGLFWKKMPRRTSVTREEATLPGFKASKDRLTLMLGGNAAGDCKLKPLLIYRSENPQALKNKSKSGLPVIWKSNSKACVTASVFEDWFGHHFIPEVERYCRSQNLPFKVILIVDGAPGHPPATLLDFDPRVKVVFLPPDATFLTQPMVQGVIEAFKVYYTLRCFASLNAAVKEDSDLTVKDFWRAFNLLDAVRIIGDSWAAVAEKTMSGAWRKLCPFFFTEVQDSAEIREVDPVAHVTEEIVAMAGELDLKVTAEDVLELLSSHDRELTPEDLAEICNQSSLEEAEELESEPRETRRTMTVSKLSEGLGLIEAGIRVLEDIDSNEQRAAATRQGIKRMLACYEEILREKKRSKDLD
ncbi:protein UXT isoform X1 [Amia ocellicauda]|uniref:protein UXT isoform X1 n=1 Tax=Amia ocellicauda TaxID=2972642 RepID=UPI003464099F